MKSLNERGRATQLGFTLVELMIVIVVISLLAAIGVPQYNEFLQDSRRSEGWSGMNQVATQLEQWHSERGTYVEDLTTLGFGSAGWNNTDNGNYRVRVIAATAACPITTCYRLRVQPVNGSAQWGDEFWYDLWSDGRRQSRNCPLNTCSGVWLNGWVND